jgi:hypothetical protein
MVAAAGRRRGPERDRAAGPGRRGQQAGGAGCPTPLRSGHGARPAVRQLRCSWIFRSRSAFGTAPTTVSTCLPSLKNRMLGIERMLYFMEIC